MRVYSHERTKVAYDGTPEVNGQGLPKGVTPGARVVLAFGLNEVTPHGAALLAQDANFKRHEKSGHVQIMPDEAPPAPAAPAPAKGGAKLTAAQKKTVEDFYGLSADERAAMYPALPDDEKALVDADPRAKAGA